MIVHLLLRSIIIVLIGNEEVKSENKTRDDTNTSLVIGLSSRIRHCYDTRIHFDGRSASEENPCYGYNIRAIEWVYILH